LIGIVGEGLSRKPGIAARCFTAAADCRVNIKMAFFHREPGDAVLTNFLTLLRFFMFCPQSRLRSSIE
jgi:hypothetical protein